MKVKENPPTEVGIIVGRFQSPWLHEAHVELIKSVVEKHAKVIIFLGLSSIKGTMNNPLDYEARKQMLLDKFPDVNVLFIKDVVLADKLEADKVWSRNLDKMIQDLVSVNQRVTLYGSRDSFIPSYHGKHPTVELVSDRNISATEIRKKVSARVRPTEDFRCGAVWQAFNKHPTVYTTVDIAIINDAGDKVLLGKKSHENKYRFIGGFADVADNSFETSARREVMEEAGLEIGDLIYVGSYRIDDPRYRNEVDKITTVFFVAKRIYGAEKAGDDIEEVRWFSLDKLKAEDIVSTHHILLAALGKYLNK